jgi:ABC-type multidrug transport system fused ATPase/permease subunit
LTNVRTVQGFVQEQQEQQRFTAIRQKMTNLDYDIHRRMQRYFFWLNLCLQISYLVTIGLGLYFVFNGTGKAGTVVFVFATGSVMIHNLDAVFHNYFKVMRNMVSVLRMNDLLREVPEIANKKSGQILPEVKGDLAFEQVDFIYRGKETPVLKDFSVAMPSNKMIALVARSGEGKTTAIRLLTRAFEVNAGRIAIDGVDIRDVDLYWYRRLFAMVQQDVEIFDATLRANIAYAYPMAADDQIIEALTAASLEGVLTDQQRFPDGVLTEVGERGIRLSGGERQRVGIARAYLALLNGARFLILDEATSNLDSEAELAIQKMLDQVRGRLNISILAIAHRLSTIRKADIIYVMGNGTVIESGSHEKLLSGNGLYSRLVEMQNLGSLRE